VSWPRPDTAALGGGVRFFAGSSLSVFHFGMVPYVAIVCTVSLRLALEATTHNPLFQGVTVACIVLLVAAMFIVDALAADGVRGVAVALYSGAQFYLVVILTVAVALLPVVLEKVFVRTWRPTYRHLVQVRAAGVWVCADRVSVEGALGLQCCVCACEAFPRPAFPAPAPRTVSWCWQELECVPEQGADAVVCCGDTALLDRMTITQLLVELPARIRCHSVFAVALEAGQSPETGMRSRAQTHTRARTLWKSLKCFAGVFCVAARVLLFPARTWGACMVRAPGYSYE
jgi:hypothetical protein